MAIAKNANFDVDLLRVGRSVMVKKIGHSIGWLIGICAFVCFTVTSEVIAQEGESITSQGDESKFFLRGFGTLGLVRSSSDQAEFVRDLSQPSGASRRWSAKTDSLLGLQGNLKLSEGTEAVAQVVSRYGNDGNFKPELMWGFVKFEPNANLSLRVGRLGTDFYMLADSRLVGYSYLTVRPPVDYFGTLPFSHIDGIDVVATTTISESVLRGKLFAGVLDSEVPSVGKQWSLRGSLMTGGHVDYQAGNWLWRVGYAQLRFKKDIPIETLLDTLKMGAALGLSGAAVAADALSVGGSLAQFYSAGVAYDHGPLQLQVMLSNIRQESAIFQNTRAGYLIASYRFGEWTPFAGYSQAKSTPKHLPATGMGALVDTTIANALSRAHTDQHTTFVGVRWDFQTNMSLKAQYDAIRGAPESIFPFQRLKSDWNGHTDVLSVTLDFVF